MKVEQSSSTTGGYFDQVSLSFVANLSAGMLAVNGGLLELIISLIIIRIGLKFFYKTDFTLETEVQLLSISALAWLLGYAILKGHTWQPEDVYLYPEQSPTPKQTGSTSKFFADLCLNFVRKII